jgi:hypothetical protein
MTLNDNRLAVTLKRLSATSEGLADWVADSERLIPGERVALQDEFTRVSSRAHTIASLVRQPATLGVIGAPRSGKTHLISSLAMRSGAPLLVKFEGIAQRLNLMRQIVPVGSRTYLGTTIRFTSKTRLLHRGFPLQLRLLSLAEVVQCLGRAYLTAAEPQAQVKLTARDVQALHRSAEADVAATPSVGFAETDALAVRDFFCATFGTEPYVQALTAAGYWDTLAELGPHVAEAKRVSLLSPLWGGLASFDRAFAKMSGALSLLGYGRDAACTLDALVDPDPQSGQLLRRTDTVLSTRPLGDLLIDAERPIVVCSEFAQWHSLDRAALTAIIAEVKFQIDAPPGSVQEHADIVEFPGLAPAEGRQTAAHLDDPQTFGRVFARAKQDLLHTRAIANTEITSMLVCVDPDGDGIGPIEQIATDWVHKTHGQSPESRETSDGGLFVVHTKFDRIVADTTAREREVDWDRVIADVLDRGFGQQATWPQRWTPQRPFDGVTFVLAPSFKQSGLFDQGSDRKAPRLKTSMTERIARMRQSFLSAAAVQRHVGDPMSCFDDAVTAGEGGMARLSKAILAVCHARTKRRQLFTEAGRLRQQVLDSSLRYFPGETALLSHDQRHGMAMMVARRLRTVAERRRFNGLMRAISVSDADLVEVFRDLTGRMGFSRRSERANGSFDLMLARAAIDSWIGRIREVSRRPSTETVFEMPQHVLRHLVDELVVGANRLNLENRIVREISDVCDGEMAADVHLEAAAICTAFAINGYLLHLGFDNLLANDHPRRRDAAESAIFSTRDTARDTEDAAYNPELDQCADWTLAYLAFVEENGRELRERHVPPEEAQRLAGCLAGLESVS